MAESTGHHPPAFWRFFIISEAWLDRQSRALIDYVDKLWLP
jgi:hypothetical protein